MIQRNNQRPVTWFDRLHVSVKQRWRCGRYNQRESALIWQPELVIKSLQVGFTVLPEARALERPQPFDPAWPAVHFSPPKVRKVDMGRGPLLMLFRPSLPARHAAASRL